MKYNFDEQIDRKGTFCTQWDYIQDRFGESGLLPFSISDTDFRVPEPIIKKLREVVDHGIYGYSRWNHEMFKGAVTRYFAQQHRTGIESDWVVYSPSVLYSISLLFRLLSKEHDRVLVFEPMYDAFYRVIQDNHMQLVSARLLQKDGKYLVDFDEFENLIRGCRIFLLCSPHNPTGRVWTREELDCMVRLCRKYNVPIISDEIHSDVILTKRRHETILNFTNTYPDVFLVSSSSKTFNTPGLIGSYGVIPDNIVRDAFVSHMRNRDFVNSVSIMGMHALMTGYGECMDYVEQLCAYIKANMERLKQFSDKELAPYGVRFEIPESTYLAWIDMSRTAAAADELQNSLVHIGKVGIMPGSAYGDKNYLRMNLGCPKAKLEDGLERMKKAVLAL